LAYQLVDHIYIKKIEKKKSFPKTIVERRYDNDAQRKINYMQLWINDVILLYIPVNKYFKRPFSVFIFLIQYSAIPLHGILKTISKYS